ncbi:MAG: alpha/beta fold hydrolase [Deltaproteobacteria bacterium]|nr:alpha/beta fold hydrolase [Deltaproteobacteria bacterium]
MEEKIRFFSGPGYGLSGVVTIPDARDRSQRHPGVILCQGYAGLKEALMPAVAERLAAEGYVTLRFDYRGFGESEGPRHRLIPLEQIEDIRNGLTCLGVRPEVDPNRLAIWGTSFGGAHAAYAAAVDERVRCIVSVVGVGDGERWLRCLRREWEWQEFVKELDDDRNQRVLNGQSRRVHPYHIMETTPEGWEFWKETVAANPERGEVEMPLECADAIIEYKPETVAHEIGCPALYVSAELDTLTPLEEQMNLYENSPEPRDYVVIPEVNHHDIYKEPHLSHLMDLSVAWFDEYLKEAGG